MIGFLDDSPPYVRPILFAVGGLALLSIVRILADAPDLTAGDTFIAAIAAMSPIVFAALGGLFAERVGVVNIGLEGMMILGTWFAGWAGWQWGPWAAIVAGAFGGALGGLLLAVSTVTFGAGPNGLAAAITLAQAGRSVLVLEAADTAGGGTRSAELTLPGFVHDVCSAVHPLAVGSPFLSGLPLERHGLRWLQPEIPLAHPLDGGRAAVLHRSFVELDEVDASARGIGDGDAVRVWNDRGALTLPARLSKRLRPGVVAVPFGWWSDQHGGQGTANSLTNDGLTDWGGGVAYSDTLVQVAPV
jgi:hypothetical protein